jgi:tungstate transport system ATP-binding protein
MTGLMELRNITKHFGGTIALDDVNLEIAEKEVFTLLGPNGSGKTTLLRIMASIEKPTKGDVYFHSERISDHNRTQARRMCTMVFQKTALFSSTVYKNVAYGLKLRGYSKRDAEERIKRSLTLVQLRGYEKRQAKKLSGGEQQRVSLARALALDTEMLLLDEPTANLDPKNVSIIENTISRVNVEFDTTVVMATHNILQAQNLTKKMIFLSAGKIVTMGPTKKIFGGFSRDLANFTRLQNVFSGESKALREGTSLVDVGDGVHIEAAAKKTGEVTIYVSPDDIILSKNTFRSSARNSLKGKIIEITDLGNVVKLKILAGKTFTAQITKRSLAEMKINIGSPIFIAFKASSVQILEN